MAQSEVLPFHVSRYSPFYLLKIKMSFFSLQMMILSFITKPILILNDLMFISELGSVLISWTLTTWTWSYNPFSHINWLLLSFIRDPRSSNRVENPIEFTRLIKSFLKNLSVFLKIFSCFFFFLSISICSWA